MFVIACFIVAAPIAWYVVDMRLQKYSECINMDWWVFVVALVIILAYHPEACRHPQLACRQRKPHRCRQRRVKRPELFYKGFKKNIKNHPLGFCWEGENIYIIGMGRRQVKRDQ